MGKKRKQTVKVPAKGSLLAILLVALFVFCSYMGLQVLFDVGWFIYSSVLRIVFGLLVLKGFSSLYQRDWKTVLSPRDSGRAFLYALPFVVFSVFYCLCLTAGYGGLQGLTAGLFISRILFQQFTTGFWEELAFRGLLLEGYFYTKRKTSDKILALTLTFLTFGFVHILDGFDLWTFVYSGGVGVMLAVAYLSTHNLLVPMVLHALHDIPANLSNYFIWDKTSVFNALNSAYEVVFLLLLAVSLWLFFRKEKA